MAPKTKTTPAAKTAPETTPEGTEEKKAKVVSRADRAEGFLGDARAALEAVGALEGAKKARVAVEAVVQARFAQREVDKMRENIRKEGLVFITAKVLKDAEAALEDCF